MSDGGSQPLLACIVLAVGAPPELRLAVRSLLEQRPLAEVLVLNSAGGDAAAGLAAAGISGVPVVEHVARLLPGAARNAGIAATVAPYVAFLAADCRAEPGWVAARIAAHQAGAAAVASSVTNPCRDNLAAWTSYVALFNRRMPGTPATEALLYGASYRREVVARCGGFREDLRTGEDTELHARLGAPIVWIPAVRTAHQHPLTFAALAADQFRRGRRSAAAWQNLRGPRRLTVAANALVRAPGGLLRAWRAAEPGDRRWVAATALFLPLAALAYAAGALRGGQAPEAER